MVFLGPGLIFKMYPVAVSLLPWPNMWSVLFFFMVFLLGVDGQVSSHNQRMKHKHTKPKKVSESTKPNLLFCCCVLIGRNEV